MRYQYQPKHMSKTEGTRVPLATRSLRSDAAAAAVTAALLPALLATPALAATQISIGGNTYTEAAQGTGSNGGTWSWGGQDDSPLNLDNYNGGAISWQGGGLAINATGENTVGSESVTETVSSPRTDDPSKTETSTDIKTYSIHDNVTSDYNEEDGTTAYTDADGNAASPSDLTITGGGTVSVDSAVEVSGGLTVTGGSTLNYGGEGRWGEEGWDEYVAADGGITVEGGSSITADSDSPYSLRTMGTDIRVTGGSKLENVDISTTGGLYVSDSSVDTPWNIVVAKATFRNSDVRSSGDIEGVYGGITLDGSEVRSGEMQPGGKIVYSAAWARSQSDPDAEYDDALSDAVVIAPVRDRAELAVASTGTAEKGVLAVRPTPVAASNAPKDTSAAAAVKTFIVSLVPTGDSDAPAAPGKVQLRLSMGAEYAGHKATVYVEHEDGTFDVLPASVDADGVVSVSTSKLSRYTVVIEDEKAATTTTEPAASSTSTASTTTTATAPKPAAAVKPAAARASASSESLPQTGDPFGATSAVLAALGALAFFEARHLRREA